MTRAVRDALSNQMTEVDELRCEIATFAGNEYGDLNNLLDNYEIFEKYICLMGKLMDLFESMDQFIDHIDSQDSRLATQLFHNRTAA